MVNGTSKLPPATHGHGAAAQVAGSGGAKAPAKTPPVSSGGAGHQTTPTAAGRADPEPEATKLQKMDHFAEREMDKTTDAVKAFQKSARNERDRSINPFEPKQSPATRSDRDRSINPFDLKQSPTTKSGAEAAAIDIAGENLTVQQMRSTVWQGVERDAKTQLDNLTRSPALKNQIEAAQTKYRDAKAAHARSRDAVAEAQELLHVHTVDVNKVILDRMTKTSK